MTEPVEVRRPLGDQAPRATLYYDADCRESLRKLPDQSVHCVVTSPPYWGLRDYGTGDAQIGLETTPDEYVEQMVEVFREVWRVLRDDGTLWLNLGDSYCTVPHGPKGHNATDAKLPQRESHGTQANRRPIPGLKHKDLVGIPWRVALALQADGWYLRSDIIWAKSSCMPESVRDRPTRAHEYLFLLTKQPKYFYDAEAIREPSASAYSLDAIEKAGGAGGERPEGDNFVKERRHAEGGNTPRTRAERAALLNPAGRNKRSWWNVNPRPFPGAHFAVFPPELVTPCVLAGTSEKGCCPSCGAPWKRVTSREAVEADAVVTDDRKDLHGPTYSRHKQRVPGGQSLVSTRVTGYEWRPTCECGIEDVEPCTVLDPFSGSGTAGLVALDNGRNYVGLDLNEEYLDLAISRLLKEPVPRKPRADVGDGILGFFGGVEGE
jgi:DNA modification methylase